MGRTPCCDKASVKKGPWSPEEDDKLRQYLEKNGTGGNWISLPQKAGLRRCGKSCRLRWLNYLRPNIKHGEFSDEEDKVICNLFSNIGSRWSIIAAHLPGRTDNDIKNYWNTKLKKRVMSITPPPYQKKSFPFAISSILGPPPSNSSPLSHKLYDYSSYSQGYGGGDGVLMFRSDVSSSSSDGGRSSSEQMGRMSCFSNGFEEKKNGVWGETPLESGFEEIEELISSNNCHNLLFEENETDERTLYY